MRRLSIKLRVTIWYTLLVALIAGLALCTLFFSGQAMVRSYYEEALAGTARLATDDIRYDDGELEIDRNLDELPTVRVTLFSLYGDLLYGKLRFELPFVEGEFRKVTDRSGESWTVQDTLLTFEEGESIWLRCYISSDAGANLFHYGAEIIAWIVPALVALASVGGFLITRRAFRPVVQIARTAESIADGNDLKKRIALEGARDEIYRLSQVFDAMLDRLERAFERERRFTSDASHELRTPVAAILAQADFALSPAAKEEDRVEALEDVRARAGQMSELLGKLLALSRMDAGHTPLRREKVDVRMLLEVALEECADAAREKNLSLEIVPGEEMEADWDPLLVTQAVLNLVGNAVKYTGPGGHVRVGAKDAGEFVEISVEDDGPGIAPEHVEHVFERFYQADASRQNGSGLGLSLVLRIAQLHGGSAQVRSELGRGSRFSLRLPKGEKVR